MEAVSDCAAFFAEADFEEGCQVKIAVKATLKDDELQVGRLRTA